MRDEPRTNLSVVQSPPIPDPSLPPLLGLYHRFSGSTTAYQFADNITQASLNAQKHSVYLNPKPSPVKQKTREAEAP
jgi:hypothetical protein